MLLNLRPAISAQSRTSFPRLEPDPKALEYYKLSGRDHGYSWTKLAEISLWTSGDYSVSNLAKIRSAVEALNNSPALPKTAKERAEFILGFMHKNLLKSYSHNQTRIGTLLSNGRFNCVSSAVLYMVLCRSAGLFVRGVMTKDHAFTILHIGESDIDVETTNPYGFDPGNRKEFSDHFGRVTGFAYVPAHNYRDRQTIGQIELISLILNNRIAELESGGNYADAVPIAVDRTALLMGNVSDARSETAEKSHGPIFEHPLKDLMDRLFNYGANLLNAGREEDGLAWAAAASSMYPDESRWQEFIFTAVNNRITKYVKAGKPTDARNFLGNQKSLINRAHYAKLEAIVIEVERLDFHNRFAAAWNKKNFDEAVHILNKGLAEFPDDRQLLSDKAAIKR